MKKIIYLLGSLLLVLMVFSACKKQEVQKANDDFDFASITPKVWGIIGLKEAVQTQKLTYKVFPRGGSTFSWTVEGAGAVKHNIPGTTTSAEVEFVDVGTVTITVVETAQGGNKSEPYSIEVVVGEFCPLNINLFLGAFECDEAGYGVYDVNFTLDASDPNTILNDNFWDWPAPGAVIKYVFDGSIDQNIDIPLQDFEFVPQD